MIENQNLTVVKLEVDSQGWYDRLSQRLMWNQEQGNMKYAGATRVGQVGVHFKYNAGGVKMTQLQLEVTELTQVLWKKSGL